MAYAANGSVVRPAVADPDGDYRCPGCSLPVVLRSGTHRRPHFAHRGGEGCASESSLHRAAKRLVRSVIDAWATGDGPAPCIARACPVHGCEGGIVQDLPSDITHAAEEVRMDDGSVADIVLFRGERPAAVIEILVTHAVSMEKGRRIGIPWVELRAAEVLERPYWWIAAQDGLRPFTCRACDERGRASTAELAGIRTRARAVAERLGAGLPAAPVYRSAPHACWRCSGDMLVYAWPGGGRHSAERPPEPIPATVVHRATEGAGNYWVNTCPHCGATQGDGYLVRENGAYGVVLRAVDGG